MPISFDRNVLTENVFFCEPCFGIGAPGGGGAGLG